MNNARFIGHRRARGRRSALLAAARLGAVAAVVAALLAQAALAAPVKVTFWHASGGEHGAVLDALVAEFNASQDEVQVEAVYQGGYGTLMQKLMAAVQAGGPPTLAGTYNNWTSTFIEADVIVPLERFANDPDVGYTPEELADFIPAFLEANTWNGVLYTLPFNKSVQILYYNKELLDQAGVAVPTTMEELAAAARAVKAKTGVPGLMIEAGIDSFEAYFRVFGGEWLDPDGRPAFHGEAGVRAVRFMQELVDEGVAYVYEGYPDEVFNRRQGAMFIHSNGSIPWVRAGATFPWGTAPVPSADRAAATVAGLDFAIFADAGREEQFAAWKFVKWFLSPQINARWSVATGYLPVRRSAVETEIMQEYLATSGYENAAGIESLSRLVFDPAIPAWNDMRGFISEAQERVFLAGDDPVRALADAARKSEQAIRDRM